MAAPAGAPITPTPFRPVLRGMLLTGEAPRYMRASIAGAPDSTLADHAGQRSPGATWGATWVPTSAPRNEDFSRCRASPARRTSALPSPDSSGRVMGADGRARVGTLARSSVALEPI